MQSTFEAAITWLAAACLGALGGTGTLWYIIRDRMRETFATRDEVQSVKATAVAAGEHADDNDTRITRVEERIDGLRQALLVPFERMNQRMDAMAQSQAATAEATKALTRSVDLLREELRDTRRERR